MSNKAKWATYVGSGLVGIFIGVVVIANILGDAFEEGGAKTVDEAMANIISSQLTSQVADELNNANSCLDFVSAAPESDGVTYKYYDVTLEEEVYPSKNIKVVVITGNDYKLTSNFSNESSCATRPNSDKETLEQLFSLPGPYIFDAATNTQIATGTAEEDYTISNLATGSIDLEQDGNGTGSYTETKNAQNPVFDTAKCCEIDYSADNGEIAAEEGGINE
jgi:hypothetical protein